MNAETSAPSAWEMLESDSEVGHLLHDRLRVASGIQALPYKDGVAILGGASAELYSGYGLRGVLSAVLPLLDGTRTIDDLVRDCEGASERQVKETVGNLFMSGLLRSGSATDLKSDADLYFDRLVGNTGVYRNGADAAERLRTSRIGVMAPSELSSWLCDLYRQAGGGEAVEIVSPEDIDADLALLLVISNGHDGDPARFFAHANRIGVPALNVEIIGSDYRVGPFVLPQLSASYACYIAAHDRLIDCPGAADPIAERVPAASALHMAISIVTRIIKRPPLNSFTDVLWKSGRHSERRTTIARLHRWDAEGMPYPLALQRGGAGYEGWKQYCGIALLTPDWHPANSYLMHFKTENILSIFERVPAIHSENALTLTPEDVAPTAVVRSAGISQATLAALATYVAGYGRRNGVAHRLVPTGGDQGSTLLMFLVRDVDGVEPGAYWFDSSSSKLERMANVDIDEAARWLGASDDAPLVMLSFANVLKVARKYGPFSVNIGWYDSGVLLAYLRALCNTLGLQSTDLSRRVPEDLMLRIGLPQTALMPTGVIEIARSDDAVRPDATEVQDLFTRISSRRAIREWPEPDVDMATVRALCGMIDEACARHGVIAGNRIDFSMLMLLKLRDGLDGFYQYCPGDELRLITAYDRAQHGAVLSQARLTEAPLIILPSIDLGALLPLIGDEGVETAYRAAGAIAGDLWLNAAKFGLGGTACGGAFEGQIRRVTGRHGLEQFAPLSLCLGRIPEAALQTEGVPELRA